MAYNLLKFTNFRAVNPDVGYNAANGSTLYDGWVQTQGNVYKVTAADGLTNNGGPTAGTPARSAISTDHLFSNGRVTIQATGSNNNFVGLRSTSNGSAITNALGFFIFSGNTIYRATIVGGTLTQNSLGSCNVTGMAFMRVTAQDASGGTTDMTCEFLNSSGNVIAGQTYTYNTTALAGASGYASTGTFNLSTAVANVRIEEYTPGGPIVGGSLGFEAISTPYYFEGAGTTTASMRVNGSSGGVATLQYAWKFRPYGSGSYVTQSTGTPSAYTFTGLTAGQRYEAYVTVSDGSSTPVDTPIFSFYTAAEVVLCVGDSTTAGVGSAGGGPSTSWPIFLQNTLAASGYRILALNAGAPGATLASMLAGMITGSGSSAVFNATVLGRIATYGINKVLIQAGANNARNDTIGLTSRGGTPSTSVAASKASYKASLVSLKAACAAAGVRLALNYPFFVPSDLAKGDAFSTGGWEAPDPYIAAYCEAIDEVQDGTNAGKRVSTPTNGSYSTYKTYWTANPTGGVHPTPAYYSLYGNTYLPADWMAAFNASGTIKSTIKPNLRHLGASFLGSGPRR